MRLAVSVLGLFVLVLCAMFVSADNLRNSEIAVGEEEQQENLAALDKPKPPRTKLKACWKEGDARGPGVLPNKESKTCPATSPEKSMGLCYPHCKSDKREGFGPLCWDICSKTAYKSNGVIFCCDNDEICSQLVTDLAVKIPEALVKFAIDISVNPANVLKILRDFRELVGDVLALDLPMCKNIPSTGSEEISGDSEPVVVMSAEM